MATKSNEIFGVFRRGGISSRLRYLDFIIEGSKIRLDNGQNFVFVYLIFLIRFIKNIKKIFFEFFTKVKYEYFNYRCRRFYWLQFSKKFCFKKI